MWLWCIFYFLLLGSNAFFGRQAITYSLTSNYLFLSFGPIPVLIILLSRNLPFQYPIYICIIYSIFFFYAYTYFYSSTENSLSIYTSNKNFITISCI